MDIAKRHGIVDDETLKKLASGEAPDSDRLHVPGHLRVAMCEIGLHCAMAPINVMETLETQAILMAQEEWNDLEFEVALDSGAVISRMISSSPSAEQNSVIGPGKFQGELRVSKCILLIVD